MKKLFDDAFKWYEEKEKEIVKNQKKQFYWFLLVFIFVYVFLSGIVYLLPEIIFEFLPGIIVTWLLQLQGLEVALIGAEKFILLVQGKEIIISLLCAGILEMIIVIGAIIASFGIKWKNKLIGIVLAIVTGFIFNVLRIWITINLILTQEAEVFELAHDLLFRMILFLYITIFYVIWFYWSMKNK